MFNNTILFTELKKGCFLIGTLPPSTASCSLVWKCFQLKCQRLLIRSVPSKEHLGLFLPCLWPRCLLSVEPSSSSCAPALCLWCLVWFCSRVFVAVPAWSPCAGLGSHLGPSPAPAGAEERQRRNAQYEGGEGEIVPWGQKGSKMGKIKTGEEKGMGDPAQLWWHWWVNLCRSCKHPAGLASAPRGLGKLVQ